MASARSKWGNLRVLHAQLVNAQEEWHQIRADFADRLVEASARIERLKAEIAELEAQNTPLPTEVPTVTLGEVTKKKTHERVGRPATRGLAKKVGNLRAWARENEIPWSTVKKWGMKGPNGTQAPRSWAKVLIDQFGVTERDFPRGIYEDRTE